MATTIEKRVTAAASGGQTARISAAITESTTKRITTAAVANNTQRVVPGTGFDAFDPWNGAWADTWGLAWRVVLSLTGLGHMQRVTVFPYRDRLILEGDHAGALLLEGDMSDGNDAILIEGDLQTGSTAITQRVTGVA